MSKLVARMEKMKSGNLGGIQRHNQREFDKHSNQEIDVERSFLNFDLVNLENINYQKRIKQIIESQRISQRAIRKDAVLVDEWIITSDTEFFNNADTGKFFQDAVDYFAERCGRKNIAYAMVHMDERTPHMHLGIVPMVDGKLSSKQVFTRQALKEIQDELPKYLQDKGHDIDRGIKGSERKHLTVQEYKENQKEVAKMSEKVADLYSEYAEVTEKVTEEEQKINEIARNQWHDDWLNTKQAMPDFKMAIANTGINVDEMTAHRYKMNFQEVLELFSEKFKAIKNYIVLKMQILAHREQKLEKRANDLDEKENALETKLEAKEDYISEKKQYLFKVQEELVPYLALVTNHDQYDEYVKERADAKQAREYYRQIDYLERDDNLNWMVTDKQSKEYLDKIVQLGFKHKDGTAWDKQEIIDYYNDYDIALINFRDSLFEYPVSYLENAVHNKINSENNDKQREVKRDNDLNQSRGLSL